MDEGVKKTESPDPGNCGSVILSIVIITKDTRELLERLLNSIQNSRFPLSFNTEIIVVDNASTDGTGELIRSSFPYVKYLRNIRNTGFAASVNAGNNMAKGSFVLFLNSDTVLIEGEVPKMVVFAQNVPEAAIVGPQLVYEDMSLQRSAASIPGLTDEIFPPFLRRSPVRTSGDVSADSPVDVESLIGAAIMVRKEVLDELGGFDERFFFFLEETDFCLRVRSGGYRVVLLPEARIIHLQGATVRKNWVAGRMEYNISLRKFIRKHHGPVYSKIFDCIRFFKALLFVIVMPSLLTSARMRMRYSYYLSLFEWYLKGCPDDAGLNKKGDGL